MKRISWTLMMSLFAVFIYAAVPTNINDYTTYGITKTGGAENAHILDIKCTYVAYKVNSCSSGELCVVGLFNPTGTNKKISGYSSNPNYYGTNSHWLSSHYTKSGNYIFFDLQAIQKGIWLLGIIQSNAGDWYYYNKDIFTITVKSNNTAYGTVSGGGTYEEGTSVTIKATPKTGYKFTQWNDGNTNASRTVVVNSDITYTATFAPKTYTITWKNYDETTLKTEQVNYGTTPSYTGSTPTRASTAQYTYTFTGWTPEIVPVTGDATYTARFDSTKVVYDVDVTIPDTIEAHGSVVIDGTPTYGETIILTPVPEDGHEFDHWSDGNTDNPREVVVDGDVNVYPIFVKKQYLIRFVNFDGSVLQRDSLEHGTMPEYTETAPEKPASAKYTYSFKEWQPAIVAAISDATYTAQFDSTLIEYEIHVTPEGGSTEGGTVTIDGDPNYGETVTLTPVPDEGYVFEQWSDGNTDNPRDIVVGGDSTIYPIFVKKQYLIQFVNYDESVLQSGNVEHGIKPQYNGETPTKPASKKYTYTFKGWNAEIVAATEPATYIAQYDSTLIEYEIHVTPEGGSTEGGTVTIDGDPNYGETVTLTPVPDEGYVFEQWSDGNTDNPRDIVVGGDSTIYPIFHKCEEIIFHISKTIYRGESYPFGNEVLTAKGTYYDTIPLANGCDSVVELKLNVVKAPNYTLRVVVNDETMGTVEGTGAYKAGTTVTITATPISNKYVFVRWYNEDEDIDVYENPYTFQLNRNLQLRAVFKKAPRKAPKQNK